jgi:hypothetical protein
MSWNKLYAGQFWQLRQNEALRVHALMRVMTLHIKSKFENKVKVTVTAYFEKSPLDADNICDKFYIDGLRHSVLVDDSPRWISSVTTESRIDKANPRVVISIEEVVDK